MSSFGQYLASDVGRKKLITVVVGLVGLIALSYGAFTATYATFRSNCDGGCPHKIGRCPPRPILWLGYVGVLGCFAGSAVVMIFMAINFAKVMEHPMMKTRDAIGHIVAGIISCFMGLYCLYWTVTAHNLNRTTEKEGFQKNSPISIGVGGGIVIVNGIVYIITGNAINKAGAAAATAAA